MDMEELVGKAMLSSLFSDNDRGELQTWAEGLSKHNSFSQSNYALTLRDLEAVVCEALHVGVPIDEAGQRVLGYYCGGMLPCSRASCSECAAF